MPMTGRSPFRQLLRRPIRGQRRPHRVPRHPQLTGDRIDRHLLRHVQPSDLGPILHADHSLTLTEGVNFRSAPGGQYSRGIDILSPGLGNRPHRTLTKLRRVLPRCWHGHHPLGISDPPPDPGRFKLSTLRPPELTRIQASSTGTSRCGPTRLPTCQVRTDRQIPAGAPHRFRSRDQAELDNPRASHK